MPENIRERFKVSYERGAAASYLTLRTSASEKVMSYQVEMLAGNRIPNILPFDMRYENGEIGFNYDITSRLPLMQFLKRKISRNEFLKIFADITKAILDCRNYFLCDNSIILDTDYIYINPATGDVSVVYIPILFDIEIGNEFKNLVMDVIINSADIDESSGDNFIHRILGYTKSNIFNICDFNKLVMDLLMGEAVLHSVGAEDLVQDEGMGTHRTVKKWISNEEIVKDAKVASETIPDLGGSKSSTDCSEKSGSLLRASKNIIFAIALQIILVAIFVLTKDYLKSLSEDTSVTYGAAVFVMAAIDALAFKKLFGKRDVIIRKKDELSQEEDKEAAYEFEGYLDNDISLSTIKKSHTDAFPNCETLPGSKTGEVTPCGQYSCDTVILGVHDAKCPFMKGIGTSAGEIILISKPEFTLGRLENQVDYVIRSSAVGKVHAQIVAREGSYFIKDLNSKNGTCINDVKIDSNEEYEIENNDRISLANNDYIFVSS